MVKLGLDQALGFMVYTSNYYSASNSLSIHIHRTMVRTLVTIVSVWWLVGCAVSMLHDMAPSLALLGP